MRCYLELMLSFSMIYVIKLLAINRGQCHHHILKRLMDQTVSYLPFSKAPPVVWFVTGPILTWNVLSLTRTGGTLPTGPRAVGIEGAGGLSRPSLILARIEAKPSPSKCLGLVPAPPPPDFYTFQRPWGDLTDRPQAHRNQGESSPTKYLAEI